MTTRLAEAISRASLLAQEPDEDHYRKVEELERAERRDRRRERLKAAGVELARSVHDAVVADSGLKETVSLGAVRRWWARRDPQMLVLNGGQGCGKSVAAAWAVATHEDSTVWVHALDLERIFAAQFGDEIKLQDRICSARLLVLDDIGIEKDPAPMCQTLYKILEKRKQRRTIVTTNLGEEAWFERYSETRLVSRFRELAVFFVDRGPDLRGGGR